MANLDRRPQPIGIKALERTDSCNSCGSDGQLLSPTLQQSVHLMTDDTLNRLTDAAKLQLRWDRAMCAELELPEGYANVYVLLIRWIENDWKSETEKEINELKYIFEDSFEYNVEVFDLQDKCSCSSTSPCHCMPQDRLDRKIERFFHKYNGPDNLIILYYTGHASYNEYSKQLELHGVEQKEDKPAPPKAIWNDTENKFILKAECDILAIMDACFAGGISATVEGNYGRSYEYLGASEWTTPSPGEKSFTRALITSLEDLVKERHGKSFTTSDLQLKIEEQKYRKGKPGVLRFRSENRDRRILLKPRKPIDGEVKRYFDNENIVAYLDLRIELKQTQLNDAELENLAKLVAKAVKDSSVETRRVDLLSLTPRNRPRWQEVVKMAMAVNRMDRMVKSTAASVASVETAVPAEGEMEGLPIQRPGFYAILGWISPKLHPHKFIIPLPRPWSWIFIAGLVAFAATKWYSVPFPNPVSLASSLISRLSNSGD